MNTDREHERSLVVRLLRFLGCFIALMGLIGLVFYYFDVADTRDYPLIVLVGTIFCVIGSLCMFYLANDVKNRRD